MNRLIHIGFGNIVNTDKIIAIVSPEAAPIKRLVQKAKETGQAIDATQGRKTKAVLVMENSQAMNDSNGSFCRHCFPRQSREEHRHCGRKRKKRTEKMQNKGILMVISGFSGAGKGTLVKKLLSEYDNYALSISMTTRQPREGEEDGREYFFRTREQFEENIAKNGFIEYAQYCGNYYGTPKAYVEEQMQAGKDVILEIEIQGAMKIKEQFPESLLLFVTPPSAEELQKRLVGRGTETADVIAQRLSRAYEESEGMDAYDYIVVNDDLDVCAAEVQKFVEAAKNEPSRRREFIKEIREELKGFAKGAK